MISQLLRRIESHPALGRIFDAIAEGRQLIPLAGLHGSSKQLVAALISERFRKPLVWVAFNNQEAERALKDFRYFQGQLDPAAGGEALCFPAIESDPYRGLSMHPTIAQQRAAALWMMGRKQTSFVATSLRALLGRLPSPQEVDAEGQVLCTADWVDQDRLIAQLAAAGYAQEDPVTEEGEYSRRGGIVDVFPPTSRLPIRVEFLGDEIVSLRTFDPESQRSIEEIERVMVTPMRERVINPEYLRQWADMAEEAWGRRSYFARLDSALVQARQGELFTGAEFVLPLARPCPSSLFDYSREALILFDEPEALDSDGQQFLARLAERYSEVGGPEAPVLPPDSFFYSLEQLAEQRSAMTRLHFRELGAFEPEEIGKEIRIGTQPVRHYQGMIRELTGDLFKAFAAGELHLLLSSSLGRAERVQELLTERNLPATLLTAAAERADAPPAHSDRLERGIYLAVGDVSSGFRLPECAWTVLSSVEVFGDNELQIHRNLKRRAAKGTAFFSDFRDLKIGDFVVHVDHGIGQFRGLVQMGVGDQVRDFVLLHYRNEAKLYLPVDRLDLIEKYSGVGGAAPQLDALGGISWQKTKSRIRKSMRDMAEELLKLYAQRNVVQGFRFSPDGPWQREFEDAFEFQETPDQLTTLADVKADMEIAKPMDRLICGDVGYGKTEIAIRAAFKAVMDGKQVALLAPTTILAFQHFNTFSNRFQAFPVRIEMLSRFRSAKEQKKILEDLELGKLDIVIGTHRLLSKDVQMKDLGLVVIDEEQRFGVSHKEKLKQLRTRIDVLTMTATPIPRTLHMSMMGIRDMSVIETPPKDRLSIQTLVVKFNTDVIRAAIEMELARSGQVYVVHNRVESIYSMANLVQRLCPQARVCVGHGQMSERQLEEVMLRFVRHDADVLVATTIIENGLDIPLVNTIIINRADRYGLAQLYQLRGRVGRSNRRAYAYLLIPSEDTLSDVARRRLAAIREFSDLGAGFRIAALDLEIRGAGNLLGGQQHGHIDAVGFDLYCQLLERTVRELKGEEVPEEAQTSINLSLDIRIPESYVGDTSQRLRLYKRISSSRTEDQLHALKAEIIDRHGPFPPSLDNLFAYARLRMSAGHLGIESIDRKDHRVHVKFATSTPVNPERLLGLIRQDNRLSFSPGGVLTIANPGDSAQELVARIETVLCKVV